MTRYRIINNNIGDSLGRENGRNMLKSHETKSCVLYQLTPFSVLIYAPFSSSVNTKIGGPKLVPNVIKLNI